MSYFKRFDSVYNILVALDVLIYGVFFTFSYIIVKQGHGIGYIFTLPDKTMNLISGHPADFPGVLTGIISDYLGLIVQLIIVFFILAIRPVVLRRYPRMKALYTGFLTGIAAVGFYQGMLNFYNVQSGNHVVQLANGTPGSIVLLAICLIAGLILYFRPLKKMRESKIRPYQIALVLLVLAILVSIVAVSITVVTNVQLQGGSSSSTTGTMAPTSNPSATPGLGTTNGNSYPEGTSSNGGDLLFAMAMAIGSILVIGIIISYFIFEELTAIYRILAQLTRSVWHSLFSKKVKTFVKEDASSFAQHSQTNYQMPGYAEDINRLAELHSKYGHNHDEYISMVNRLSDKYHIDTSQIVYDQWSIHKM